MHSLLLVGAGGALGAILRYVVSGVAYRLLGTSYPWGTLAANVIGCFLIGLIWAVAEKSSVPASTRLFVLTGILGAFTTFSTFGLETMNLFRDGEVALGLTNVVASNVFGLVAVVLGFAVASMMLSGGGAR